MNEAPGVPIGVDLAPACRCAPAIPAGIQAVVFDFDGTLADTTSSHEQALRAALAPYGLELDHSWYRQHVGLSIHDLLAALPGGRQLPHDEIIQRSRAYLLNTVHSITPVAGVVALLHAARRAGLPCAVASGASRRLVHPGIEALGLRGEFAAVVAREDVAHGKPAADLYLVAARRLGVPADRCLAVDDAPDGVTSARAAGMHVITLIDGRLAPADEAPPGAARVGAPADALPSYRTPPGGERGPVAADQTATTPLDASPPRSGKSAR